MDAEKRKRLEAAGFRFADTPEEFLDQIKDESKAKPTDDKADHLNSHPDHPGVPRWMVDRFRKGYHPMDEPPGLEEHYYKLWKLSGGQIDLHEFKASSSAGECDTCGLSIADPIHSRPGVANMERLDAALKAVRTGGYSTLPPPSPQGMIPLMLSSQGAALVMQERERQIGRKGYTAAHDDGHDNGELAFSAAAFVIQHLSHLEESHGEYEEPWATIWNGMALHMDWHGVGCNFKWKGPIHSLTVAGALICAEIDRLIRADAARAESHTDKFATDDLAPDPAPSRAEDRPSPVDGIGPEHC